MVDRVHGTATVGETQLVIGDEPVLFGRDPNADITIGRGAIVDDSVPRLAGRISLADGRIAVTNLGERLAISIETSTSTPVWIRPQMLVSPPERDFQVVVFGVVEYRIVVSSNWRKMNVRFPATIDSLPTGLDLELTERQVDLLDAYSEPVRSGGLRATHAQVAAQLAISRSLVRLEANAVWSTMLLAGVPLRNVGDNIEQVVDAWLHHDLPRGKGG